MVSPHAVEHQMLICKQQGDVALSLSVFNTLHLFMMLVTTCLYTSFIAILVDRCLFFIKRFLILLVCATCLYTSFSAILMDRSLGSSSCFISCCRAPSACIQASGRFYFTVFGVYQIASHKCYGHHMLAYKLQDTFSLPSVA
jgi:hypothetical protein